LLELLVVIGILSVVTMVSWPMLQRPLNRSVAQDAGQQLQRALAAARFYAMESGNPVYFQYQVNSGQFWLGEKPAARDHSGRDSGELAQGELADSATIRSTTAGSKTESANDRKTVIPEQWGICELPEEVVFVDESADEATANDGSLETVLAAEEESKSRPAVERTEWSYPVTFFPGGRVVPARIRLLSAEGYRMDVEIQGLAGRIKVFPPHR
jgi:type II secretory pathway pseudopilin PulG